MYSNELRSIIFFFNIVCVILASVYLDIKYWRRILYNYFFFYLFIYYIYIYIQLLSRVKYVFGPSSFSEIWN